MSPSYFFGVTPSQIGERAEAAVVAALVQLGKIVYLPFGASGRSDLIFEDDDGLHRVQVKNGVFRKGAVAFATCSHTGNDPRDYRGQVEFLGVYCHELQSAFLVPARDLPRRAGHLRLAPTQNNQRRNIRWAEDYRLPWSPPQLVLHGHATEPGESARTAEESPEIAMP